MGIWTLMTEETATTGADDQPPRNKWPGNGIVFGCKRQRGTLVAVILSELAPPQASIRVFRVEKVAAVMLH